MQGMPSVVGVAAALAELDDADPDDDDPEDPDPDPDPDDEDAVDFAVSPSVPSTSVTVETPVTASVVAPGTYFASRAAPAAIDAGY
ncbi:MAG: hypothetical protein JWP75_720 [Frondihabitans sp.]|nr:hypothetical protein [Frondihabitans sp.]